MAMVKGTKFAGNGLYAPSLVLRMSVQCARQSGALDQQSEAVAPKHFNLSLRKTMLGSLTSDSPCAR